ncbi:hypothetical protein EWB00_005493 [Schistosoma japonicum]|uniref:Uncharacterized protein n=1 Tax=Schistosoma japonicum TaxID=6182 RepID=A0A4Z2D1F7_SCHJA|nr:hypothetical protein EWB00_005493 [Schistosoma japonicum]
MNSNSHLREVYLDASKEINSKKDSGTKHHLHILRLWVPDHAPHTPRYNTKEVRAQIEEARGGYGKRRENRTKGKGNSRQRQKLETFPVEEGF